MSNSGPNEIPYEGKQKEKKPVMSHHPEYDEYVGRWETVKNVVKSDVKEYIKNVEDEDDITTQMNLPRTYATPEEEARVKAYYGGCIKRCKSRNKRYKDDAQFVNFTARTKAGLVGAIFRKDTVAELPPKIDYLIQDATGSGVSLNKLAQEIAGEILMTGRYGLLVDYPRSVQGITRLQEEQLNFKARILKYDATSIINWQTSVTNGVPRLSLVVLEEVSDEIGEDKFTWQSKVEFRVLRMVDGEYRQSIYDSEGDFVEEYTPVDSTGAPFREIPFVFVGSEDNDAKVDSAPLFDLAMVNIGHLRNSADYEESIHICGSPTLILTTDYSPEDFERAYPGGVKIGARRGYNLGPNSSAQFLQASPNQLADVAMQRKEEQARLMGARMTTLGGTNETAEGVRMRLTGETCELTLVAENISSALERCCYFALLFMGSIESFNDVDIQVNTDFFEFNLDPTYLTQLIQLYINGVIALPDLRRLLRQAGSIPADRLDDDIDKDVAQNEHQRTPLAITGNG